LKFIGILEIRPVRLRGRRLQFGRKGTSYGGENGTKSEKEAGKRGRVPFFTSPNLPSHQSCYFTLLKIICLMAGGATGTLLRYALAESCGRFFGLGYQWGTLLVNWIGALLIGLLWGWAEVKGFSPALRALLFTGLLGGFTTFSTFALDAVRLGQSGQMGQAALYVVLTNVVGIGLTVLGLMLVKNVLS
jgi:CrcB protein